jgi:hypothetical protein
VPQLSVRLLAACAAALATTGAAATATATSASTFRTPSGNIGCLYTPASGSASVSLRCDLARVAHPPARPASCRLSYGRAFVLNGTGRARRGCVGDTVLDGSATVIRYGSTRHFGPFTCTSRESGLSCHSLYHHGFTLSQARQRLY